MIALCERLEQTYTTVCYGGLITAKVGWQRVNKTQEVPDDIVARVVTFVQEVSAMPVMLPVNFGNQHWCGAITDVSPKVTICYDSLANKSFQKTLDDLFWRIAKTLTEYGVVTVSSPIQFDGFSYGVFVCCKFWRPHGPQDLERRDVERADSTLVRADSPVVHWDQDWSVRLRGEDRREN